LHHRQGQERESAEDVPKWFRKMFLIVALIVVSFQENEIALLQNTSLFVVTFILGTVGSSPLIIA
jgi:hypothetical protein